MQVWYCFIDDCIKAIYSNCSTKSEKWKQLGYIKFNRIEDWMNPMVPLPPEPIPTTVIIGTDKKEYQYTGNKWEEVI